MVISLLFFPPGTVAKGDTPDKILCIGDIVFENNITVVGIGDIMILCIEDIVFFCWQTMGMAMINDHDGITILKMIKAMMIMIMMPPL